MNDRNDTLDLGGLLNWHADLTGKSARRKDGSIEGADREVEKGRRADLKRASSVDDVMLSPAFASLVVAVSDGAVNSWEMRTLARTAFILSRVDRCAIGAKFPLLMASPRSGKPVVSTIRANNLFRLEATGEACLQIVSILPLVRGSGGIEVDPFDIYRAMSRWDDVRRNWATDYHVAVQRYTKAATA